MKGENSTGVEAFGSCTGLRENINLQNRNLNIVVPLFTLRGRNGLDLARATSPGTINQLRTHAQGIGAIPEVRLSLKLGRIGAAKMEDVKKVIRFTLELSKT